MNEAIYIVEYNSIPIGIDVLDQMVKRASVTIIQARPICIGKYLIVLGGAVDDMREAQAAALSVGPDKLLSQYLLTNAHHDILAYFKRIPEDESSFSGAVAVGIFEVRNIANGFRSLDAALKSGNVQLGYVWNGHFIGGKFCFLLTGSVEDISMALKAAENNLDDRCLVDSRVIPSPDAKTLKHLFHSIQ